jgi:cytochrome c-type biogenesis protein CcmH/NrfG
LEILFSFIELSLSLYLSSFDPAAESNCEELLKSALQVDPENTEALQTLASVRMSQQRPEEAKEILEKAWSSWKDMDAGVYLTYLLYLSAVRSCFRR